ncbi:MAG: hypothetical protein V1755_08670 [Chloroflexota bacterium]
MTAPRKPTDDFPPVGWRGLASWYSGQWESVRRDKPGGFIRRGERYDHLLPDLCSPLPGETWPGEDVPGACPICHGEGRYNEGTGYPSDEGGEEYRTVECFDCDGTGELAVAFERARARCMDLLSMFNEADASRRRLHRSLRWAMATLDSPPLPGFSLASSDKLEQARLDLAYEENRK